MQLLPAGTENEMRFELLAEPGNQVFVGVGFNGRDPTVNVLMDDADRGDFQAEVRILTGANEC